MLPFSNYHIHSIIKYAILSMCHFSISWKSKEAVSCQRFNTISFYSLEKKSLISYEIAEVCALFVYTSAVHIAEVFKRQTKHRGAEIDILVPHLVSCAQHTSEH